MKNNTSSLDYFIFIILFYFLRRRGEEKNKPHVCLLTFLTFMTLKKEDLIFHSGT